MSTDYIRVPKSPVCAKGGIWPYPCRGRVDLRTERPMKGSYLCEEHAFQAISSVWQIERELRKRRIAAGLEEAADGK